MSPRIISIAPEAFASQSLFVLPNDAWNSRELAQQLSRDVVPKLDSAGVRLVFIAIGTAEKGRMFAEETGLDVRCNSGIRRATDINVLFV